MNEGSLKGNNLQTLDRALELLEVLGNSPVPMSVIDLSKQLKVNRTSLYAMLNSLQAAHYVDKDPLTGKYLIGHKIYEVGQMYRRRFPFLRTAQTYAFSLMDRWNLNTRIAVYINGGEVLLITDEYPVGIRVLHEGSKGPAHATAMGKVLLAGLPDDVLEAELQALSFDQYTSKTITDRETFSQELSKVRKLGFGQDNEEYVMGLACYAAPIKDVSGRTVASLSISGETGKILKNSEELIRDVMITARNISNSH